MSGSPAPGGNFHSRTGVVLRDTAVGVRFFATGFPVATLESRFTLFRIAGFAAPTAFFAANLTGTSAPLTVFAAEARFFATGFPVVATVTGFAIFLVTGFAMIVFFAADFAEAETFLTVFLTGVEVLFVLFFTVLTTEKSASMMPDLFSPVDKETFFFLARALSSTTVNAVSSDFVISIPLSVNVMAVNMSPYKL
jgi:hypothetical protein